MEPKSIENHFEYNNRKEKSIIHSLSPIFQHRVAQREIFFGIEFPYQPTKKLTQQHQKQIRQHWVGKKTEACRRGKKRKTSRGLKVNWVVDGIKNESH